MKCDKFFCLLYYLVADNLKHDFTEIEHLMRTVRLIKVLVTVSTGSNLPISSAIVSVTAKTEI